MCCCQCPVDLFHVPEHRDGGEQCTDAVDYGGSLLGAAAAQRFPQFRQASVQRGLEAEQEAVRRVGVCIAPEFLFRLTVQGIHALLGLAYGRQAGGETILPDPGQALPAIVIQEYMGIQHPGVTASQTVHQGLYVGKVFVHEHLQV